MQHGQVIVGVLSLVCVIFITAALGDGRSVIFHKTVDGVGVGVSHDYMGKAWDDEAHPTRHCDSHQKRGQTVKAFSLLACISSSLAVIVSLIGAGSVGSMFFMVNLGLQAMMFVSFLIAMSVGWALVDREYHCDGLGVDVRLLDSFEYNYGLFFLLTGTVASLANIVILVVTRPGNSPPSSHEPAAEEMEKKDPES